MDIKLPDTYPYFREMLRSDYPEVSFPISISDEVAAEYYVFPVTETPKPVYTFYEQTCEEAFPVEINNVWTQQWQVRDTTDTEKEQITKATYDDINYNTKLRLDNFAKTYFMFDNMADACSFYFFSNMREDVHVTYAISARDETWAVVNTIFTDVESGVRPLPEGYADIEDELPPLAWPE